MLSKFCMSTLSACISSALIMSYSNTVFAYQEATDTDAELETIAVVGARGAPRSITDSPVPVDVLSSGDIESVAFSDMNDVLKTLVPSYSLSRQPISDGGTFIRPATLRGLPTDKTLVLVNSKRRHRAALVQIGGSGTQGPDIATIPASAIASIEVLRDGAAAQYGSDAIAGVINFQLKNNSEGGSFSAEYGQYFEGDGDQITITGNKGFALGDDGFFSLSGEFTTSDATSRGEQYCETWFCLDPTNPVYEEGNSATPFLADPDFIAAVDALGTDTGGVVQPWGQPNNDAIRLFFNSAYMVSSDAEIYAFGNYTESEGDGSFFYRYPGNSVMQDIRLADGSIWNPIEIFPGGFTPRFFGEISDFSFLGGYKSDLDSGLSYDLSARYGKNEIAYTLKNTFNPSLANNSPTQFKPGDLVNTEMQLQADFTYMLGDYVYAWGLSYLDESYEVVQGEEASYIAGDYAISDPHGLCDGTTASAAGLAVIANGSSLNCADSDDPVYQIMGVGSNGFPGYSPEFSEKYSRDSYAIYGDVSGDITDALFAQFAIRYEDYSDFGSEVVYKLAAIYAINDDMSVRSSFGTGFRAPTPGQQGTTNVSTRLPNGFPVATGLFPALSDVSQALGASALRPETSQNFTFGITSTFDSLNITLDYYHIALEDRVNSISTLDVSTDVSSGSAYQNYLALANAGVAGAESIGGVFYFQNAFDTVTEGVDLVANYNFSSEFGTSVLTGSLNYNRTEFDSDPSEFINVEGQFDFENGSPRLRGVLSFKHDIDEIGMLFRLNYYGPYENKDGNSDVNIVGDNVQEFSSTIFFDVEGSYQISENITLIAGIRNLFDEYPDISSLDGDTCCGRIYRSDSEVDWQGGFYYTKLVARF